MQFRHDFHTSYCVSVSSIFIKSVKFGDCRAALGVCLFIYLAPPSRLVKEEYGGESVQVEGNMGSSEGRSDYRSMSAPGKIYSRGATYLVTIVSMRALVWLLACLDGWLWPLLKFFRFQKFRQISKISKPKCVLGYSELQNTRFGLIQIWTNFFFHPKNF